MGTSKYYFQCFSIFSGLTFEPKIAKLSLHPPIRLMPEICKDLRKIYHDMPEIIRNKIRAYSTSHRDHQPLEVRPATIQGAAVTAARHGSLQQVSGIWSLGVSVRPPQSKISLSLSHCIYINAMKYKQFCENTACAIFMFC